MMVGGHHYLVIFLLFDNRWTLWYFKILHVSFHPVEYVGSIRGKEDTAKAKLWRCV